jgi:frataxin-like iron-binding protein CyaY
LANINDQKIKYYKIPLDYNSSTKTVYADRENNVWIANEPGILKVSNFNVQSYAFHETAAGGGSIQIENDSSAWLTNSKSLYHITGNDIQKKDFIQPNPSFLGLLHFDQQHDLWMGAWNDGIWRTKWKNGQLASKEFFYHHQNKNIKAPAIVEDLKGNILVGGPNGIFRIQNGKVVEAFHPLSQTGRPAVITTMTLDEKNKILWVGDNATGIIKLQYKVQRNSSSFKTLSFITAAEGLQDEYIRVLLTDQNHDLWVGTRVGGIYKISDKQERVKVVNYSKPAGVLCTRITDIKLQRTQAVWFATCNGIYKYEYATDKWTHYNTSHGLLNAEVYSIALDAKNNLVWALTAQGVTRLLIDSKEKPVAPLINIVNVNVLGKPDTTALLNSINKFSYSKNSIGFHFTGASFIDEKKIRYKYMLEGYDKEWSEAVTTNSVSYASLPPGTFLFKVIAQNANGQWSDAPAFFKFEIIRPFYRSPWFPFLLLTAVLIVIYFVRIQRLKNRYKIEKLRMSISSDLHDDIGSTLSSISILSDIAAREKNHSQSQDMMQEIKQSSVTLMEKMDDIVWSINPGNDSIEDLMLRIKRFASRLFEAKEIDYSINID